LFIYIDESGSFVVAPSANSWNVIAAFVAPETNRKHAELALRQLKLAAGRKHDDEVKLRDVSESQLGTFLARLAEIESLVFVSAIDLGSQDSSVISRHQTIQVEKIRANIPRMIYPEGRALIEDLASRVAGLSAQLYIQMVAQIDLLDQVYRQTTLYYSQRVPATLSSFRWRIDEKNSSRPIFEETLRHLAPPILQSKSLREPSIFVHEFDYSHYERTFRFAPGEMPTYLQEETGIEIGSGSNLGKVLKDFAFVRSHDVPGVQIADLLASTFRRVLRSDFERNVEIARGLGRIMVQRPKPQPPIHLISLSEDQYATGHVEAVARVLGAASRGMIKTY
jgi:hypothetical protein